MDGQGGWPTKSGGREAGERARVTDEWRERYSLGDRQSAHRIGRTVRRICPPDRLSSRSDLLKKCRPKASRPQPSDRVCTSLPRAPQLIVLLSCIPLSISQAQH